MSCFESKWGNGKTTKANLKELKAMLVEVYKLDYAQLNKTRQKNVDKPSSRMTNFSLIGHEGYEEGNVLLNMTDGTFQFSIPENNHAVDAVKDNSRVFVKLTSFIRNMPANGKLYGATVYYVSEYSRDGAEEFGGNGVVTTNYGAWRSEREKKLMKRRAF